jgi:hypothetical protein
MVSLIIAFHSSGKKPLSVATVENRELLRRAAQLAIEQAGERATSFAALDPLVKLLQAAEVQRLRTALNVWVSWRPNRRQMTAIHSQLMYTVVVS